MLFFENASRNRGLLYRAFKNIKDAIKWFANDRG